jgi:hypothetical protein
LFGGLSGTACGQGGLIGSRGGLISPSGPTLPTSPVLPSTLNLPAEATNSLLNGLNAGGTALRPGMGWLTSDLTHQGIQGQQLADIIHQLHPYQQDGRLTFPQSVPANGAIGQIPGFSQPGQLFPLNGKGLGNAFGKGFRRR